MWDDLSISYDTKQMLNKLLEHHRKKEWYLHRARVFLVILCLFGFSFVVQFYMSALLPSKQHIGKVLELMFADKLTFFLLIGTVGIYTWTVYYFTKFYSCKQKLDKLRMEAIERLYTVWVTSNKSELKDLISKRMKERGVNLSYKAK